jgi:hypothetical protein
MQLCECTLALDPDSSSNRIRSASNTSSSHDDSPSTSPVHRAQMLTYLKLARNHVGLLTNFNVIHLKEGIERFVF